MLLFNYFESLGKITVRYFLFFSLFFFNQRKRKSSKLIFKIQGRLGICDTLSRGYSMSKRIIALTKHEALKAKQILHTRVYIFIFISGICRSDSPRRAENRYVLRSYFYPPPPLPPIPSLPTRDAFETFQPSFYQKLEITRDQQGRDMQTAE